jgi:hypothetical protein
MEFLIGGLHPRRVHAGFRPFSKTSESISRVWLQLLSTNPSEVHKLNTSEVYFPALPDLITSLQEFK